MAAAAVRNGLIVGLCLVVCVAGRAVGQDVPTTGPVTIAALPEGWDQIDQRLVFLTVELSSAESSLDAINKAITATGYQQAVKTAKAQQYQQGNEMMDRNGGGPIPWQDFYGKTASQFYYHPSSKLHASIHGGRVSDAQVDASSNGGPLYSISRPPQLDYIYRANADEAARAQADAARLGQQVDKLLARRRELETEQSALWCKISFRALSSLDLSDKPIYLFDPVASAGNGDQEQQEVAAIAAGRDFIRAVDWATDQAQSNVDEDQRAVYANLEEIVGTARREMDRQLMRQNRLGVDLQDPHSPLAEFAAAARRLEDSSQNLVDEAKLIADSDTAGDEGRKSDFRGQLQQTLMDFASTTATADQCLVNLASQWKVLPNPEKSAAELNLKWNDSPHVSGVSPANPVVVAPAPNPPSPMPAPVAVIPVDYHPDPMAIAHERARIDSADCRALSQTIYDADLELSQTDKPYRIDGVFCPARRDGEILQVEVDAGVEIRGGTINLGPPSTRKNTQLLLKGTEARPIVLRNVTIDEPLSGGFKAEHVIFDQCIFQKSGGWSVTWYSSKWEMSHCLLYKCTFPTFKTKAIGFNLADCTLIGMSLPEITFGNDQDPRFDYMDYLQKQWNLMDLCSFVNCSVPPTVFWCSKRSNFLNCSFVAGAAFKSNHAAEVIAYVDGTTGKTPQEINSENPPTRRSLNIVISRVPYPNSRWDSNCPVPEVRLDERLASVVLAGGGN